MPTVLVINEQQLFSAAILSLLVAESTLKTIGYTINTTVDLIEKARQFQPDLIVLDHSIANTEMIQQLLHSAQECRHVNLIVVDLHSNWVSIYTTQEIQIKQLADLMAIIHTLC